MTRVPLFPLGTLLVPGQVLHLNIFEPRYRLMVEHLQSLPPERREFAVVSILAGHEVGAGAAVSTALVGTMAAVRRVNPTPGGVIALTAIGRRRFRILERIPGGDGFDTAEIELLPDTRRPADDVDGVLHRLGDRATAHLCLLLELLGRPIPELPELPDALSFAVLLAAPLDPTDQQRLLAIDDTAQRLRAEIAALQRERHLLGQFRAGPRQGPIIVPPAN